MISTSSIEARVQVNTKQSATSPIAVRIISTPGGGYWQCGLEMMRLEMMQD
jgi:hypothetical protein